MFIEAMLEITAGLMFLSVVWLGVYKIYDMIKDRNARRRQQVSQRNS